MNLRKKKKLIARILKVGVGRIKLNSEMQEEIKEAITRQDIKDLKKEKIVSVKQIKGRKKKVKRKTKRRQGSIKKKVNVRKRNYMILTRKLREHIKNLKDKGEISKEEYCDLRKKIKAKRFRDFAHLKNSLKEGIKK